MKPQTLSKEVLKILDIFEGKTTKEKVITLVQDNLSFKLQQCEAAIGKYEAKYGMTFEEFKKALAKGKIKDKFSYEVESDYLEWEAKEDERKIWLERIKEIRKK